jgi:magnesium chelatase subunit I
MAENVAFPLTALVGQDEVKDALLLAAVNPRVQGVLLIGAKGTGKTTAVRGLLPLLPTIEHSTCEFGCDPAMALTHPEELCDKCREKLSRGEAISYRDKQKVVELPLNATLDDVVGGVSLRASLEQQRVLFEPGLLSHAHRNILYIDEINLLDEAIVDAILDAAATGYCVVRRGRLAASYPSEFVLVGSMNPEEGDLRPQIMDRIGLRVYVSACSSLDERLQIARRARQFRADPVRFMDLYAEATQRAAESIQHARAALDKIEVAPEAEQFAVIVTSELGIESHRAEIVLMEAARAYAALSADDGRQTTETGRQTTDDGQLMAGVDDVKAVAPLVLRRRKSGLAEFEAAARREDEEIRNAVARASGEKSVANVNGRMTSKSRRERQTKP